MNIKYTAAIILTSLSIFNLNGQAIYKPAFNSETIVSADKYLKAYHSKREHVDNIVKVVYFHAADQKPLNNWQERLTVTLEDVSKFYKEEFAKFGIQSEGIPFEKQHDGQFVFHVIQGSLLSKEYNIRSGNKIQNEIYNKSNHQIDFLKDHVLIINGLCDKREDGCYFFHAPYYGTGNSVYGVRYVADCELLDSRLLSDTTQRMTFTEMFVTGKKCTVAEFNSWYIGGIAHEMGHLFGLPHDFGNPLDLGLSTLSLMGQYGSRRYREYLWNSQKSSVFTSAGILQLLNHPVFAQTKKLQNTDLLDFKLYDFKFLRNSKGIVVKMNYKAKMPPYGVVALLRPTVWSEYFNRSFSTFCTEKDSLSIGIGFLTNTKYFLQLKFLFPDGSVVNSSKVFTVDNKGDAKELPSNKRHV